MKKPSKHINAAKPAASSSKTPKANWADDRFIYSCQNLITCCTGALREGADSIGNEVTTACSQAIVCANVAVSCFTYFDEASLAERIGACNELSACCQLLVEALADADFDGAKGCLESAQACYDLCAVTAGTEQEEGDGPAHPEGDSGAAAPVETVETVVPSASAKSKPVAKNPNWLKIVAKADSYEMQVNGFIGASVEDDTGVSGKEFADALAKIPAGKHIDLRINSEGGSVADGLQIYNLLKDRRPDVTSYVDGVALSCASLIALAAEHVISPKSSVWMIHSPRLATYGDTEEHKKSIKMLKSFTEMMADVYADETGHDRNEILSLMEAESWFTGTEAVAFGLATAEDDSGQEGMEQQGQDDEAEAHYRARAVLAMYRPPEKVKQIISRSTSAAGVTGIAASNSQNKTESMSEKATTVTAAATPPAKPDFETRFNEERKARITAEVTRRAEGKVKNENLPFWVDAAFRTDTLDEEQRVYAQIDSMPQAALPGGRPIPADIVVDAAESAFASRRVDSVGNIVELGVGPQRPRLAFAQKNIHALKTPEARVAAYKRDWSGLLAYAMEQDKKKGVIPERSLPEAANSFAASLTTDFLVDEALTILINIWASLSTFTRDFGVDRYKPLATGQVKFVTAGATTLTGTKSSQITNFEQGNSTVKAIQVAMTHFSQPFQVTQDDMMNGLRLENLMSINLGVFANSILSAALQPIATGALNSSGSTVAYSAGTYHALPSSGTFGWSTDMPRLRGYLAKSPIKNAVLDGAFYSFLANQPAFFQAGLDGGGRDNALRFGGWNNIQENSVWPSVTGNNGATLGGFFCNPQAIGTVSGLPLTPPSIPGATLMETIIQVPGPDIYIANYLWFSLASRTLWTSFDVVFGSSGGDASAGAVLFNGAGPRS